MENVDGVNDEGLWPEAGDDKLNAVDGSRSREAFRRSVVFTAAANLVALYLLAVSSLDLSIGVCGGLAASQTGLLAARVGLFGGLSSWRLGTAVIGLVLHAAAVAALSAFVEGSTHAMPFTFSMSLAGFGLAMAGVALMTWFLTVRGRTRLLNPFTEERPRLRFSILDLLIATTIVAALAGVCRWTATFEQNAVVACGLFTAHQVVVIPVALIYFGTMDDAFRAGYWTFMTGGIACLIVGVTMGGSLGFAFVFEVVQSAVLAVWLSAWRGMR